MLSEIARNSIEKVGVKKSVERFSRRLNLFKTEKVWHNYCKKLKDDIGEKPLYIMDDTEIVKPLAKQMEGLSLVRDGSDDKIKKGYFVNEMLPLTKIGSL